MLTKQIDDFTIDELIDELKYHQVNRRSSEVFTYFRSTLTAKTIKGKNKAIYGQDLKISRK